jgi:hypothetical protein
MAKKVKEVAKPTEEVVEEAIEAPVEEAEVAEPTIEEVEVKPTKKGNLPEYTEEDLMRLSREEFLEVEKAISEGKAVVIPRVIIK